MRAPDKCPMCDNALRWEKWIKRKKDSAWAKMLWAAYC